MKITVNQLYSRGRYFREVLRDTRNHGISRQEPVIYVSDILLLLSIFDLNFIDVACISSR